MKTKLFCVLLGIIFALSLPRIYVELTNPARINSWYDSVLKEELGGLSSESAFYKLSAHGFRIVSTTSTEGMGQRIILEPPYDQGLLGFFMVRIPFPYIVETNNNGIVVSYGLAK